MTATLFPAESDAFANLSDNPRMNDPTRLATAVVAHVQNAALAMQNELRSALAARWEQVDMHSSSVAASSVLTASAAINLGTITNAPDAVDYSGLHPGIIRVRSGGTLSGGFRLASGGLFIGAAGLSYRAVFAPKTSVANSTLFLGLHNGTASTGEPTTGCYLAVTPGGTATFKCASAGVRTSAGTTATLVAGVWVTVDISWVTASSARCVIRNDGGAVVLDQTVSSNVPSSSSLLISAAWSGFNSAVNSDIAVLDSIAWGAARPAHCAFPS